MTGKIARKVMAFSLLKSAKKSDRNKYKIRFVVGLSIEDMKHKKDEIPKSIAIISSLPLILATTSV
jgi:hypothetical protein